MSDDYATRERLTRLESRLDHLPKREHIDAVKDIARSGDEATLKSARDETRAIVEQFSKDLMTAMEHSFELSSIRTRETVQTAISEHEARLLTRLKGDEARRQAAMDAVAEAKFEEKIRERDAEDAAARARTWKIAVAVVSIGFLLLGMGADKAKSLNGIGGAIPLFTAK